MKTMQCAEKKENGGGVVVFENEGGGEWQSPRKTGIAPMLKKKRVASFRHAEMRQQSKEGRTT